MIAVFLACLVVVASADGDMEDLSYPGKCPGFSPVENYDVDRYVEGKWYQAYYHGKGKYFQQFQCPEVHLQYNAEDWKFTIDKYYLNQSHPVRYTTTKEHIKEHPGSFQFPQSVREEKPEWFYQVTVKILATDYDHYSLAWGCYDIEGKDRHYEFAVINSRTWRLAPEYYEQAKAYFTERHPTVDFHRFYWDDCRATCPNDFYTTPSP